MGLDRAGAVERFAESDGSAVGMDANPQHVREFFGTQRFKCGNLHRSSVAMLTRRPNVSFRHAINRGRSWLQLTRPAAATCDSARKRSPESGENSTASLRSSLTLTVSLARKSLYPDSVIMTSLRPSPSSRWAVVA